MLLGNKFCCCFHILLAGQVIPFYNICIVLYKILFKIIPFVGWRRICAKENSLNIYIVYIVMLHTWAIFASMLLLLGTIRRNNYLILVYFSLQTLMIALHSSWIYRIILWAQYDVHGIGAICALVLDLYFYVCVIELMANIRNRLQVQNQLN